VTDTSDAAERYPLWYKDAVIYELPVKSFRDSNADGIGDFRGLIEKLDYLEDLGVTAVWLLPFYPSPQKDDGYDISDYTRINPDFGTLRDFRVFLREAHKRGIRVITELIINHTSDQHAWFQRSRKAPPGSSWRNFYVWSDTPEKYQDARIIFKDFEASNWTWDPVARAYYWHRFYSHQPDLNFDHPLVQKGVLRVLDFWLGMGVDGLRLDAVPYLFEREGTNCENLPETHAFLKKLRAHVDEKYPNRMLLAEANQWPEDSLAYFGNGDECHMAFHFPVMPRLFMALRMEDRFPIVDIMDQTPSIPGSCQWAMFLRNHDELTLEMVTDEERDYMYQVYARDSRARINLGIRRRLAPLLENNRRKIELMYFLLFSLPGTPVLYYADEIGMGDNYYLGDRNGVRTPMQWSPDRNAGFSSANPQQLYLPVIIDPEYRFETVNVENQERNLSSLLWWMKRVIAMRKRFRSMGRGDLHILFPDNPKVMAFTRTWEEETVLVVANLSRFCQLVELPLAHLSGMVPQEAFSQNRFPVISEAPYNLTLGPYDHYWFLLEREEKPLEEMVSETAPPPYTVRRDWKTVLEGRSREWLEVEALPPFLARSRWFAGKNRTIQRVTVLDALPLPRDSMQGYILIVEVRYLSGPSEIYLLPLTYLSGEERVHLEEEHPGAVVASLRVDHEDGVLIDAVYEERFRENLLNFLRARKTVKGQKGSLAALPGRKLRRMMNERSKPFSSRVLKGEQSNTSLLYNENIYIKLYRKLEEGTHPEPDIIRFLTEKTGFANVPSFGGTLEYRRLGYDPFSLVFVQEYVTNEGDGWTHTLDTLGRYYENVLSRRGEADYLVKDLPRERIVSLEDLPPAFQDLTGGLDLEMTALLGKRTAQMHCAMMSRREEAAFAPESFSMLYQRSVYQSMRNLTRRNLELLKKGLARIPRDYQQEARSVLQSEAEILSCLRAVTASRIRSAKIRTHGDYHLGQVLFTGKDFMIIDFEGEPARALSERRLKRSALRDVAGMIRSFHYAAYGKLLLPSVFRPDDIAGLEPWAELWYRLSSAVFLHDYRETAMTEAELLPLDRDNFFVLLDAFLLEKAVYELGYELNNRPEWVGIPLRGIKHLLEEAAARETKEE